MKRIFKIWVCYLIITCPARAQTVGSSFDKQLAKAVKELNCPLTDQHDPVGTNAVLIKENSTGKMAIVIKAVIAPGWHLYSFVPADKPYITTQCTLKLPPGITTVGDWEKTSAQASGTDRGVLIWEREAVFVLRLRSEKRDAKGTIQVGLSYQTCDLRQCLPPAERSFNLNY
ncbi:protein-disulfide reductase DsbD domain-containing protein [Flavitalea flava]